MAEVVVIFNSLHKGKFIYFTGAMVTCCYPKWEIQAVSKTVGVLNKAAVGLSSTQSEGLPDPTGYVWLHYLKLG